MTRKAQPAAQADAMVSEPAHALPRSAGSIIATDVKHLLAAGEREQARARFGDLVDQVQRRAIRVAYQYLRDPQDADEAVQDALLKVFLHLPSYREEYPFEVWFMRILINGCLDLRKARTRRGRWFLPLDGDGVGDAMVKAPGRSVEEQLIARARVGAVRAALERLPVRQKTVFMLKHFAGQTTEEVGQTLGLSEATVRVHLFRAVRRLRALTEPTPGAGDAATGSAGRERL